MPMTAVEWLKFVFKFCTKVVWRALRYYMSNEFVGDVIMSSAIWMAQFCCRLIGACMWELLSLPLPTNRSHPGHCSCFPHVCGRYAWSSLSFMLWRQWCSVPFWLCEKHVETIPLYNETFSFELQLYIIDASTYMHTHIENNVHVA